jgi:hypothetical protein
VDKETGVPDASRRGKNVKQVSSESAQTVLDHINSFPRFESHYSRSSIQRQYLDPNLSVLSTYFMYCSNYDIPPVKLHTYREIFTTKFNLGFHCPRKYQCDKCEVYKRCMNPTEDGVNKFEEHESSKAFTKKERGADKAITDTTHAVLRFDLENVICLPHAKYQEHVLLEETACV